MQITFILCDALTKCQAYHLFNACVPPEMLCRHTESNSIASYISFNFGKLKNEKSNKMCKEMFIFYCIGPMSTV